MIAEYLNGALSNEYIYMGDQLVATHSGTTLTYHHRDLLSVRVNTDGTSGAVVGEQGHYPYGEVWYSTGTTTKYLFTSFERDPESGNDYARQRYNANRLGRFMSPDPVMGAATDPQSLNRYSYVANDPINGVDPNGTFISFLVWPFGDCTRHPRWSDDIEFWLGHLNICPFLPWVPFIRELSGGGGDDGDSPGPCDVIMHVDTFPDHVRCDGKTVYSTRMALRTPLNELPTLSNIRVEFRPSPDVLVFFQRNDLTSLEFVRSFVIPSNHVSRRQAGAWAAQFSCGRGFTQFQGFRFFFTCLDSI